MWLDQIPSADVAPADAAPSEVRPGSSAASLSAARRTVVAGMVTGALAAVLVPFDWALTQRAAHAADPERPWPPRPPWVKGPTTEFTKAAGCKDYGDYDAMRDNWPRSPRSSWACHGGTFMGTYPCNPQGFHREWIYGMFHRKGVNFYESYRIKDSCATDFETPQNRPWIRNAWRWKAPNGKAYRCSDADTLIRYLPHKKETWALTISKCEVPR